MNAPRPSRCQHRQIVKCICLVLLGLLCACISLQRDHQPGLSSFKHSEPSQPEPDGTLQISLSDHPFQAPVYPYSVIPGGVSSPEALQSAVAVDPVVARHYAGFDVFVTRVIQLKASHFAFVSYRRGNDIFWTRNKVKIPAGESLLSDGNNLARTRCGNRLSEVPKTPTSSQDPPLREMENPVSLQPPLIFGPEPSFTSEWANEHPDDPLSPPADFPPPSLGQNPPLIFGPEPIPPIFARPTGGDPPQSPTPPPVSTAEPGTLVLLLAGACAAFFGTKRSNSSR